MRPPLNRTNWLRQTSFDRNAPIQETKRALARDGTAEAMARFEAMKRGGERPYGCGAELTSLLIALRNCRSSSLERK